MLTLLAVVLLGADSKLTVEPSCSLDVGQLAVHVVINTAWRAGDGGTESDGDKLYSFTCDMKTKRCRGSRVSLEPLRGRLAQGDVIPMVDATLKSVGGRVAVVEWGVHQFVVDIDAGTVTKTATGVVNGPERGVGRCK